MKEAYDLRTLTVELTKSFPEIEALYLFGSRRYRTGSLRSDVDILVELRERSHIRPQELRAFSAEHCRALDLFVAEGGRRSAAQTKAMYVQRRLENWSSVLRPSVSGIDQTEFFPRTSTGSSKFLLESTLNKQRC